MKIAKGIKGIRNTVQKKESYFWRWMWIMSHRHILQSNHLHLLTNHCHSWDYLKLKYQEESYGIEIITALKQIRFPLVLKKVGWSKNLWSLCPWEYCRVDREAGCNKCRGEDLQMTSVWRVMCIKDKELWVCSTHCSVGIGCWVQGSLTESHLYGGTKINHISFLFISSFPSLYLTQFPTIVVIFLLQLLCFATPPHPLSLFCWCFHITVSLYNSVFFFRSVASSNSVIFIHPN